MEVCEKRTSEIERKHARRTETLVQTVQISRRCVAKRTSEINRVLENIGNYHADRAEVCPKANLRVVNTVQIAGRCVAQQTSVL